MVKKTEPKSELEKKYRILVENMGEGLCLLDKNMVPIYVNRKFCEITGFPKDEIWASTLYSLLKVRVEKY